MGSVASPNLRKALSDVGAFSRFLRGFRLRAYQLPPARAITTAVLGRQPGMYGMVFSRQAGKDEVLAQMLAFLLLRFSHVGGEIVVAAPTKAPQANLSRDRLLLRLQQHPFTRTSVRTSEGYRVHVGQASALFLSAGPGSNARGHTASLMLIANEAQDIDPGVWDSVFDPMAASTNAPTLFMGTVWTSDTLLARQMSYMTSQEQEDGQKRLYLVPWQRVAEELPAYGNRVRERIAQLGADHPFIRTEYELLELSGDGGMFPAHRQQLMHGSHPRRREPFAGETIALLIDVAGADEAATIAAGSSFDPDARRDSSVATVVSIDYADDLPRYRVIDRAAWTNVPWPTVEGAIRQLLNHWRPAVTVIDATGIGFGMWSRLHATEKRFRIEPFVHSMGTKSELGWKFLGIIDSGRLQDYAPDGDDLTTEHHWQVRHTLMEVRPGPARTLSYGVPARSGHDDSVMSLALIGILDDLDLRTRTARGR